MSYVSGMDILMQLVLDVVSDDYIQEGVNNGDWPFGHVVELLVHDMFDPGMTSFYPNLFSRPL